MAFLQLAIKAPKEHWINHEAYWVNIAKMLSAIVAAAVQIK